MCKLCVATSVRTRYVNGKMIQPLDMLYGLMVKRWVYTLEKEVPATMNNDCDSKMFQKKEEDEFFKASSLSMRKSPSLKYVL